MFPPEWLGPHLGVVLIDLVGGLLIVAYVVAAGVALLRGRGVVRARLLAAEGATLGLSFKVAGTLLKTIELHTWEQILMFCVILALRVLLKRLFVWEAQRLRRSARPAAGGLP